MPAINDCDVNTNELAAVLLALHRWAPFCASKTVQLYTDNTATLYALRRGSIGNIVCVYSKHSDITVESTFADRLMHSPIMCNNYSPTHSPGTGSLHHHHIWGMHKATKPGYTL